MRNLTLVLVKLRRIERRLSVEDERGRLTRIIGDLEIADRRAAERGDAAGRRDDVGDVCERAILAGAIVDCVTRRDRASKEGATFGGWAASARDSLMNSRPTGFSAKRQRPAS